MTESTSEAPAKAQYDPQQIETAWMERWLASGHFHAEVDESRPAFSIVVPPPNVTGALHMGHALNGSIQDVLTRVKRMQGYNALWLPGIDHAGIATQNVVEKQLRAEGKTRYDLGRDAFVERVWAWKDKSGSTILEQFKRLGCSMDYARERFTMDEGYARAVQLVFVKLFEQGYIYRGNRLVNWCGDCATAISDLEVRQVELTDEMFEIDYPLADGGGHITVATVRPETVVADVAVAVHPDDARYRDLVGKHVRVPLTERTVQIVADAYVDPSFGTGALKITPGHDPNDFAIGEAHGLPQLSAIEPDLTMSVLAGRFAGMHVSEARTAMVDAIDEAGLLRGREPYKHSVPHCDRSGTRVEPLISLQWFCDMTELAKPAVADVADREVEFTPAGAVNIFNSWMDDLKPWCVSRQLWWGHQLPVWYCDGEDAHVHVSLDGPSGACPDCGAATWTRDEDVLDTWFSSGLWSFATLGWPDDTPELRYFHPTSVLCTAREIINLWVARMMMLAREFVGEKPFSDVYIHSVVQAPDGRRMSKSLGTGVDPLDLIGQYGADATRYGMLTMSSTQDVRFNEGKIREGKGLATKLWNAVRLVETLGDPDALPAYGAAQPTLTSGDALSDRWIVSRTNAVAAELTKLVDAYEFALYAKDLYRFVHDELCDWALEAAKGRLGGEDAAARRRATEVLGWVVDTTLRLTHPVMPHITEALAERLWGTEREMLVVSAWPGVDGAVDADAVAQFEALQGAVTQVRSLRSAAGAAPGAWLAASLTGDGWAGAAREVFARLARVDLAGTMDASGLDVPVSGAQLKLGGLDAGALRDRLAKDLKTAHGEARRAEGKLANEKFVAAAPAELVAEQRAKLAEQRDRAAQLEAVLAQLGTDR